MTRVLLLSSDTGEGHNSAAAALEYAGRAAGLEFRIRKPLEESGKLNRSFASLYNLLLGRRPEWISNYFRLIERVRPNEADGFYSIVRRYIGRFLESTRPDIVLSVHPMLNHFIQRFIKEERRDIPCYTFVTDPFPPFWHGWASPYVDRYFVPTDEALRELIVMGIPASRIERTPMPVRPQFAPAKMSEIAEFRQRLSLREPSIILVNGGARGGGAVLETYEIARLFAPASNILVICGRNRNLRRSIEKTGDPRTRVFGFLEDIHQYVAASDLVITKPGAMSTYESLACGVPVALMGIGALMPQESGLFTAALKHDFGYAAATLAEMKNIVSLGSQEWASKRAAVQHFYRATSGAEFIERIQPVHVRG